MRIPPFSYMRWTKRRAATVRIDLTASGAPPAVLPPLTDAAVNRAMPVGDGDARNEEIIAARYGVPPEHVLFVPGTTMANFLLVFALFARGDRVLVESPAYENLPGLVTLLGGVPVPLPRPAGADFAVEPELVETAFAAGLRLAFLTDLHNPTGVRLDGETIDHLRTAARRHGATVILDEVYRDFADGPVGTGYRAADPSLVACSSLTKVYGMGALRTGWIFAPPGLRQRCAELLDYLTVLPPAASAVAAEHVLVHAEDYRERGRALAARGLGVFEAWVATRDDVLWSRPAGGLVAFPGFRGIPDTGPFCEWLRTERETLVVPGAFFGAPDRMRVSLAPEPDVMEEGLAAIAEGVERFRQPA